MTDNTSFDVVAFDSPFKRPTSTFKSHQGMTISDIIRDAGIDPKTYLSLEVTLSVGARSTVVPIRAWHSVRPKAGTHVQIAPVIHGALIAPLLSTVLAAAAPTLAGAMFPALAAAGGLGIALATAGVSVVGALLIRALIPPATQASTASDDPVFNLTAASNAVAPYEPYPTILGRHIMYPKKTTLGFTEVEDDEIYLRERMTFGYGPVALSELKIGTTPITDFEGVEVEFLNVDETLTKASMPLIDGITRAWRTGTDAMTLYPDDIAEDTYSVLLADAVSVTRQTQVNTLSAAIDISFQGLVVLGSDGSKGDRSVDILIEYQEVGTSGWTTHETKTCTENTTAYARFTSTIDFPSEGEYSIRLTRQTADSTDTTIRDLANLTAIRSVQSGELPSHADISEIAIRIKASNELNGQLQNLNAVVQQLAPVYDGTSWGSPEPVRHPAWIYAAALTGPQLRDAVSTDRLDADALKAWADDEPHWTCDMVIEGANRLADVLDYICATGRARRGLSDLKYSVIRDGGAGSVVQMFTPRNSWGFSGRRYLDREIHAFRVQVVSEYKGWAVDEVVVYNDGYDASTATEIETLSLPGVVIALGDGSEGNAYRLARYHMAVATLRPEEFSFSSDLDHLVCQMGDKVRIVHDVPMFGLGSGRITERQVSGSGAEVMFIDEDVVADPSVTYRITIRRATGVEEIRTGRSNIPGRWALTLGEATTAEVDDIIIIEETAEQSVELLITGITHTDELQARITAVPAAPDVLTADTGTIPSYDPQITTKPIFGPVKPTVVTLRSGLGTAVVEADKSLTPRAGVQVSSGLDTFATITTFGLRWLKDGSDRWVYGDRKPWMAEQFTGPLEFGVSYSVGVASFDAYGNTLGWVDAGDVVAGTSDNVLVAPLLSAEAGVDYVSVVAPKLSATNIMEYRIYAATDGSTALTLVGTSTTPEFTYKPPASSDYTRYKVVGVDYEGVEGTYSAFVNVEPTKVRLADLASDALIDVSAAQQAVIDAEAARDDAEAEALDAAVDASAAEGHAIAAAADAAEALVSEGAATLASSAAGLSAAEAATQAGVVVSVVRSTLPGDFQEGGTYFTSEILGDPATVTDSPATEVEYLSNTDGDLARFDLSETGNKVLATKGVQSIEIGRDYRITARVRQSGAGPIRPFDLQSRYLGDDFTSEGAPDTTYSVAALDVWETFTHDFSPLDVAEIYCRPLVRSTYVASTAGHLDIISLTIEDVTSEVASDASATASAASELSAGAYETAAGLEAATAAISEASASTDAGIATTKATEAATSATEADDAAVAAQTSETATARLLSQGAAADPVFSQWPTNAVAPDNFSFGGLNGTTATAERETAGAKYTNAVKLSTGATPSGANPFLTLEAGTNDNFDIDPEDADLILVTAELELVSGAWGGARFRIQWNGSNTKNVYWYPIDTLSATTGVIQKVEFTVERPAGYTTGSDNYVRLRFHGTSNGEGNTREVNEIICHSMDMRVITADSTAAITKAVKATTDGWSSSYLGFQTAVVGAETVMSLYAFNDGDTPVSGVKIDTGTFFIDSDMTIFKDGIVQSDNYAETAGVPTAGWQLDGPSGTIKGKSVITTELIEDGALKIVSRLAPPAALATFTHADDVSDWTVVSATEVDIDFDDFVTTSGTSIVTNPIRITARGTVFTESRGKMRLLFGVQGSDDNGATWSGILGSASLFIHPYVVNSVQTYEGTSILGGGTIPDYGKLRLVYRASSNPDLFPLAFSTITGLVLTLEQDRKN